MKRSLFYQKKEQRMASRMHNSNQSQVNDHCVHDNCRINVKDFVQVIDNKTEKIIIQGQVQSEKTFAPTTNSKTGKKLEDSERLISVDEKYFFKLNDERYTVIKLDNAFVDENFIKEKYSIKPWGSYNEVTRNKFNMFRENTLLELDKEVDSVVHTLNEFSPYLSTTGSCSGHDIGPAWITMRIYSSRTLIDFINILVPYKHKMVFTTEEKQCERGASFHRKPFFPRYIEMSLRTKEMGKPAYKTLDDFDNYLKRVIALRDNSYALLDETIRREKAYRRDY